VFCLQSHGKFREMISAQQLISCDMGGTCAGGYDGFTARHFENADGTPKAVPGECFFISVQAIRLTSCFYNSRERLSLHRRRRRLGRGKRRTVLYP
jgi:hypothetical protein